jgi:hypothetical protein
MIFVEEIENTGYKGDEKSKKGKKSRRYVYVKNFLDNAHGFLNRSVKEYGTKRDEHHKKGNKPERCQKVWLACQYYSSIIKPNVR